MEIIICGVVFYLSTVKFYESCKDYMKNENDVRIIPITSEEYRMLTSK